MSEGQGLDLFGFLQYTEDGRQRELAAWAEQMRARYTATYGEPTNYGFIEFALMPLKRFARDFNNQELRVIDEGSRPRYFKTTFGSLNDIVDGIEFLTDRAPKQMLRPHHIGDYWRLEKDGRYYCAKLMEENYRKENPFYHSDHPPIWLDTTIIRIKELFEHSVALARALGIQDDTEYLLRVSHIGIQRRIPVFSPNENRRDYTPKYPIEDYATEEAESVCLLKVTSKKIEKNLHKFIKDITFNLLSNVHPNDDISEGEVQWLIGDLLKP